jgi:hypothetical protein
LASFRISFQRSLFPAIFLQPLTPTFSDRFQRGLAPFTKEELFIVSFLWQHSTNILYNKLWYIYIYLFFNSNWVDTRWQ